MSIGVMSKYIAVRGRFHRSVQLVRDVQDVRVLREYVLTPTAREVIRQITDGLRHFPGERAWSITGPYGTGKSALALFLTVLLSRPISRNQEIRRLQREVRPGGLPLVPVLVVGERASFVHAFLAALAEGISPISPRVARKVRKAMGGLLTATEEVVDCTEEAASAAKAAGRGGLLIIIDEFGKFLEHAALYPETEDLLVLQQLSESAARSQIPILLLTILHTSFAEYLHTSDQAQRMEWQKVQGRFSDVAFLEPPEQLLRLVGRAIERKLPPRVEAAYQQAVKRALRTGALDEARRRFLNQEVLLACAPLHPVTALLLWPLFRSKLAQNERSLFAFLTSQEPYGFQEFLSVARADGQCPAFYLVDRLYDHVVTSLGAALYGGDRAHRWAEIGDALDRVAADAPPLAASVVKTVGLIGLYGPPVGLRPSQETLSLALNDRNGVSEALAYLERSSILVYRKHDQSYALWEGSDVDLDLHFEKAQRHVAAGDVAGRIKQLMDLRPVVARAHYIRTGTLRYFIVDVIGGSEQALRECLDRPVAPADGSITYVLTPSARDRKSLIELARMTTRARGLERRLRLLAFPKPLVGLEDAIGELEAWLWIRDNVLELQGDPVARREVRARLLRARERLEELAGRVFGPQEQAFSANASVWVQGGEIRTPGSTREFREWLSELCDRVFHSAPNLRNELLNRDRLSSAAAKARRNLLEAMLENEAVGNLGFVGTPPEASMYRSLLLEGGFHRPSGDQWHFGEPDRKWRSVWRAIQDFLTTTEPGRRPIQELYELLKGAPYGMREGPLPVILCAALLAHRDEMGLYEDGLFVPELRMEVLERLIRAPEMFEVQRYSFSAQDRAALRTINRMLRAMQLVSRSRSETSKLLGVVKALTMFAGRLPAYTRQTRRTLDPRAIAVRDTLLQTRDPYGLLREELPTALGVKENSKEDMAGLPVLLRDSLIALQREYPRLLDEIEAQARDAFGLGGSSQEARQQLKVRAAPLQGYSADQGLTLLVREAARLDGSDDWREAIGRVVNGGMPPRQWRDIDVVGFQVRLIQMASDFVRLEELLAEKLRSGATQILRIGVLDGRLREAREIVAVTREREAAVEELTGQIAGVLETREERTDESRRVRLAALARVVAQYLQLGGGTNDDGETSHE